MHPANEIAKAYYWLAKNYPPEPTRGMRGRTLETLRLRVLRQASFDEIVKELGGDLGTHSARIAWARRAYQDGYLRKKRPLGLGGNSPDHLHPANLKSRAHALVAREIRRGNLLAPGHCLCTRCNDAIAREHHHEDYTMPLAVTPLCIPCHRLRHKELKCQK